LGTSLVPACLRTIESSLDNLTTKRKGRHPFVPGTRSKEQGSVGMERNASCATSVPKTSQKVSKIKSPRTYKHCTPQEGQPNDGALGANCLTRTEAPTSEARVPRVDQRATRQAKTTIKNLTKTGRGKVIRSLYYPSAQWHPQHGHHNWYLPQRKRRGVSTRPGQCPGGSPLQ